MTRRVGWIAAVCLGLAPAAFRTNAAGRAPGVVRPPAAAAPAPSVHALIATAARQEPAQAVKTLRQALQVAQGAHDRKGVLVVADAAQKACLNAGERGEDRLGEELARLTLEIREKYASHSPAYAISLSLVGALDRASGRLDAARARLHKALTIIEHGTPNSLDHAMILGRLGWLAWDTGDLGEARRLYQEALDIRRKRVPNTSLLALSCTNLAEVVQRQQKDDPLAIQLRGQAIEILNRVHDGSLEEEAALEGLGRLYWNAGENQTGYEFDRRAFEITKRRVPGSVTYAGRCAWMASWAQTRHEAAESRALSQEAMAILADITPPTRQLAKAFRSLGVIAFLLACDTDQAQDFARARELHERVRAILEKVAPGSAELAMTFEDLGNVAHFQADHAGAIQFYGEALTLRQTRNRDSPDAARLLKFMGIEALGRGYATDSTADFAKARAYYEQARSILEKPGSDSMALAEIFGLLGDVARAQFIEGSLQDLKAARDYDEQGLRVLKNVAPESKEAARHLRGIALTARLQGDLATESDYARRALKILEKEARGSDDHADALFVLARTSAQQGDAAAAKEYARQSAEIYSTFPLKEHFSSVERQQMVSIALAWEVLAGDAMQFRANLEDAWSFGQHARDLWERLEPGSREHAGSLDLLASVAATRGDYAGAVLLARQALEMRQKVKPDSSEVAESLRMLGWIELQQGNVTEARKEYEDAQQFCTKQGLKPAALVADLSLLALDQGDLGTARQRASEAVDLARKLPADEYLTLASVLIDAGVVSGYSGQESDAQRLYDEAVSVCEQRAPYSIELLQALADRGWLALRQGDIQTASDRLKRAALLADKLQLHTPMVADVWRASGDTASYQNDFTAAKASYERAWSCYATSPQSLGAALALHSLAKVLDEQGRAREAREKLEQAVRIIDQTAPQYPDFPEVLRSLARLREDAGDPAGAADARGRAERIEAAIQSLPSPGAVVESGFRPYTTQTIATSGIGGGAIAAASRAGAADAVVAGHAPISLRAQVAPARPEVRFLEPAEESEIHGGQVQVRLEIFSPQEVAGISVWVNWQPVPDDGGRGGIIRAKGDREALAKELPKYEELIRQPRNQQFAEVTRTLEIPPSAGEFIRIAVAARTDGGITGPRRILRLRNPEARSFRGRLRVLSVGVGAYRKLPPLRFAAADARDLAAAFQAQAGERRLYREASVQTLIDAQATRSAIRAALAKLSRDTQAGDTLVLLFSGHGLRAGNRYYFAPVDADDADPGRLAATALPWSEVVQGLQRAREKARAVWILADCCRAEPGLTLDRRMTEADLRRAVPDAEKLTLCTASRGNNPSYESESLKHGFFTQAWLDILHGQAPGDCYTNTDDWGLVMSRAALLNYLPRQVQLLAGKERPQEAAFADVSGSIDTRDWEFAVVPGTQMGAHRTANR